MASAPGEIGVYDAGHGRYDCFRTGNAPDRTTYAGVPATADTRVPALGVPDVLGDVPQDVFPFLLKVDVEGAEKDIFAGSCDWLDRFPIIMIEPHDWMFPKSGAFQPFLRRIADAPRDFLVYNESVVSIAHDLG